MSSVTPADPESSREAGLTAAAFWSRCAELFEGELPRQQFETWVKPLAIRNGGDHGVPSVVEALPTLT